MARALATGEQGATLRAKPKLAYEQSPYRYTIERQGAQSIYRVTDGKSEIRVPIAWAFGLGAAGQTYVLERKGVFYESRVSYYRTIDGLALTSGARPSVPRDLEEAFGRELSEKGAIECFQCHSTGAIVNGVLRTAELTPGVQCERCHAGAARHAEALARGSAHVPPRKLAALSTEEMSDFCGQCHRTWAQIAAEGPHNISNVRFQPYRLANSSCYDAADPRIRCVACHDPHKEMAQPLVRYDANCQSCHQQAGRKTCRTGKDKCVTCHMPKIEIKETYNAFTDHWIRIARPGEPHPH
ncbi:MAG TPA: hypothetical protein DEH78_20055 [Solibacterales bacterium]|nr:hypothetical protein [Bryobacterales bacterium]